MNKILFTIGFFIILLPIGMQFQNRMQQESIITSYWEEVEQMEKTEVDEMLAEAKLYNEALFSVSQTYDGSYEELLNASGNGIMASIEIPRISLKLPIYHGTEEKVLSEAIGHLKGSSLPVGGNHTHAILTGHRGLPGAQLFTRLDEMEKDDVFYIRVCDEVLCYQVQEIQVVEPDQVEVADIRENQDLVSLITCTPYGINTHRLVITGKRVAVEVAGEQEIPLIPISKWEMILISIPLGILVLAIIKRRKTKRVMK